MPWNMKSEQLHQSEFAIIVSAMKRTLNTTINRSKSEKNDEHYTQLADIENDEKV